MNRTMKVPFQCPSCKKTGTYIASVRMPWDGIRYHCKHGCGFVRLQIPMSLLQKRELEDVVSVGMEAVDHYDHKIRKGRRVA